MNKLDELKQEATELGVSFSPNIGEAKLQEKINAYYESQETNEATVARAVSEKEAAERAEIDAVAEKSKAAIVKRQTMLEKSKAAEARARQTKVVTIIDNDPRVNAYTQTVTVTCANEYFSLGTITLPLGMKVEVQQGHLNVLKELLYPHHQLDKSAGTSKVSMRRRYSISDESI